MQRRWQIAELQEAPTALRRAVGGHPLIARLLAQRSIIDPARAQAFLDASVYTPNSPEALPGLDTLVESLIASVLYGRPVRVWGDPTIGGQMATAVLVEALAAVGVDVSWSLTYRGHHPDRREEMALLIGNSGADEAPLRLLGPGERDVAVHPRSLPVDHPLRAMTGAGVAYLFAQALWSRRDAVGDVERLLDLVAVGLIADGAMLTGDVRYLVQRGIEHLHRSRRPGLIALAQGAELDLGHVHAGDIRHVLVARLQAAERGDSVRLMLADEPAEAERLAAQIEARYRDRRARGDALVHQLQELLRREPEAAREPIVFLEGEGWDLEVLGVAANALARDQGRPVVLVAHQDGGASILAARSAGGLDIGDAMAQSKELLSPSGRRIAPEAVPMLRQNLLRWAQASTAQRAPGLQIDALLPWREITLNLARELARLAPFGRGNSEPTLMVAEGELLRVEDVSRRQQTPHRRLWVRSPEGETLTFTWFRAGDMPSVGEVIDVAFRLRVEHRRGEERMRLLLVDWRVAEGAELALGVPGGAASGGAQIVAGRAVVDWRHVEDWRARWEVVRDELGSALIVWAEGEGALPDMEGALSRTELPAGPVAALGIASAPPDPATLRQVLTHTSPSTLYLLPVAVPALSAETLLRQVAGMLRVALSAHEGWLHLERMAARIGVHGALIMAALRVLEGMGRVAIRFEAGRWRAYHPEDAPALTAHAEEERSEKDVGGNVAALRQLLREMAAYRRAYQELPPDVLLSREG